MTASVGIIIGIAVGMGLIALGLVMWKQKSPDKEEAGKSQPSVDIDIKKALSIDPQDATEPKAKTLPSFDSAPLSPHDSKHKSLDKEIRPRPEVSFLGAAPTEKKRQKEETPKVDQSFEKPVVENKLLKDKEQTTEKKWLKDKAPKAEKKPFVFIEPEKKEPKKETEERLSAKPEAKFEEKPRVATEPLNVAQIIEGSREQKTKRNAEKKFKGNTEQKSKRIQNPEEDTKPGLSHNYGKSGKLFTKEELELLIKE